MERRIPHPRLAELLQRAVAELGVPKQQVARAAGLKASHLSQLLAGTKSASREKIGALADVLSVPREILLQAAGHDVSRELGVEPVIAPRTPIRAPRTIQVITDPQFIDCALFMWILYSQPLKDMHITCEITPMDWHRVPAGVDKAELAVGFYNRRSIVTQAAVELKVRYWADLTVYRGYALLARRGELLEANSPSAEAANRTLTRLVNETRKRKKRRPTIISIGADTVWRLRTPLVPVLNEENFSVDVIDNAEQALDRFLSDREGELFVGGFPQRLRAKREGCVEVLSSQIDPFLFSLNTMICSSRMFDEEKAALSAVSALWFETVARIKSDAKYRRHVLGKLTDMLSVLGVQKHSFDAELFELAFTTSDYELFPDSPAAILDGVLDIGGQLLRLAISGRRTTAIRQKDLLQTILATLAPRIPAPLTYSLSDGETRADETTRTHSVPRQSNTTD